MKWSSVWERIFLACCTAVFTVSLLSVLDYVRVPPTVVIKSGSSLLRLNDDRPTVTKLYENHAKVGKTFSEVANKHQPITDKITAHAYQLFYDKYFTAGVQQQPIKILEIGLGCDMNYGPGASANIWTELFPNAEIWFAEYDAQCVAKHRKPDTRWKAVTGDQGDPATVKRWVTETGGNFDFIIDDGGHRSPQMFNSFRHLWPELRPGGIFFIEDMKFTETANYYGGVDGKNGPGMATVIGEWTTQLILGSQAAVASKLKWNYPLPVNLFRVECMKEICAFFKN